MEQNQIKNSPYAERAKRGERLTWHIYRGDFKLITDKLVEI